MHVTGAPVVDCSSMPLVWFGSRASLVNMSAVDLTLTVGDDVITPAMVVRDLGVYLDAELTMKQHVNRTASSCFRQIRRSAGRPEVSRKLVSATRHSFLLDLIIAMPH